jgi:hypothetical protein
MIVLYVLAVLIAVVGGVWMANQDTRAELTIPGQKPGYELRTLHP